MKNNLITRNEINLFEHIGFETLDYIIHFMQFTVTQQWSWNKREINK